VAVAPPPVRPVSLDDILAARERIRDVVVRTPLIKLRHDTAAPEIWLKLENLQPINAFKIRGAANAVALLSPEARKRGVAIHPVQRPPDRHDIEAADIVRQVFGLAPDQGEGMRSALRRLPRGGQHGRLRIDSDEAADIGGKAERQRPGSGPEVDQRVLFSERQPLRHLAKEGGRIRRPQFLV